MDRHMVFGFLLVLATIVHENDGKALSDGHTSWLQPLKPLVRHQRDLPPEEMMENTTWVEYEDACNDVTNCHYVEQYGGFYEAIGNFRIGEFYENLDSWCTPRIGCWDDNCQDEGLKMGIESTLRVMDWLCSHREAFRETACYRDPFAQRMETCSRVRVQHDQRFDHKAAAKIFTTCVMETLDELPGCSRNNGFADFFRFVMSEMEMLNA